MVALDVSELVTDDESQLVDVEVLDQLLVEDDDRLPDARRVCARLEVRLDEDARWVDVQDARAILHGVEDRTLDDLVGGRRPLDALPPLHTSHDLAQRRQETPLLGTVQDAAERALQGRLDVLDVQPCGHVQADPLSLEPVGRRTLHPAQEEGQDSPTDHERDPGCGDGGSTHALSSLLIRAFAARR